MSRIISKFLAVLLFVTTYGIDALSIDPEGIRPFVLAGTGYIGGLSAGDAVLDFSVRERGYFMHFNAESTGLMRLLFDWRFELEAQGLFDAASETGLQPTTYRSHRHSRGRDVARHVRFHAGIAETVLPVGGQPPAFPVAAEERTNVLDPASAFLAAGLALARTGRCDQVLRVFDGKRRRDVTLTDRGDELLPQSHAFSEQGFARRCSFLSQRVAGYSERQLRKPPIAGDIWFKRYSDSLMLPVRLQAPFRLGTAVFHFRLPANTVRGSDPAMARHPYGPLTPRTSGIPVQLRHVSRSS